MWSPTAPSTLRRRLLRRTGSCGFLRKHVNGRGSTGPSLTKHSERRIVSPNYKKEATMSVMCSLAVCKAQAGMCGHEKVMLSVAMLAAIGLGAYFLIS